MSVCILFLHLITPVPSERYKLGSSSFVLIFLEANAAMVVSNSTLTTVYISSCNSVIYVTWNIDT